MHTQCSMMQVCLVMTLHTASCPGGKKRDKESDVLPIAEWNCFCAANREAADSSQAGKPVTGMCNKCVLLRA